MHNCQFSHSTTAYVVGSSAGSTAGVIRDNPAELAKPPREPDRETDMLQPDKAELLERLRGRPFYTLASLGVATDMRRNEMLALLWQDIDLDAGRLTVEQALEQTAAHGIRVKAPKTRHGRRTISLPVHIVTELRQHWREQQELRLAMGLGRRQGHSRVRYARRRLRELGDRHAAMDGASGRNRDAPREVAQPAPHTRKYAYHWRRRCPDRESPPRPCVAHDHAQCIWPLDPLWRRSSRSDRGRSVR